MKIIKGICPSCGGQIEINSDLSSGVCSFCGVPFLIDNEEFKKVVILSKNTQNLLKRIFLMLEDGDFEGVLNKLDVVFDEDPENAMAYLAKLMAELKVNNQEDLGKLSEPFDDNVNYKRAMRFAYPKLKEELAGYINEINERNEKADALEREISHLEIEKNKLLKKIEENKNTLIDLLSLPGVQEETILKWSSMVTLFAEVINLYHQTNSNIKIKKEDLEKMLSSIISVASRKPVTLEDIQQKFGKYENEFIEWIVLKEEADKVLLLSKNAIEAGKYNETVIPQNQNPWEASGIRAWLNQDFYSTAFTRREKQLILENNTALKNGATVCDKVFLLSPEEVEMYLPKDSDKISHVTEAAKSKGIYLCQPEDRCLWWLRQTGTKLSEAPIVDAFGKVDVLGLDMLSDDCGIRPAIWVSVKNEA